MGCGPSTNDNNAVQPKSNNQAPKNQLNATKIDGQPAQVPINQQPQRQMQSPRLENKNSPRKSINKAASQSSLKNNSQIKNSMSPSGSQKQSGEKREKTMKAQNPEKIMDMNKNESDVVYFSPSKVQLDIKQIKQLQQYRDVNSRKGQKKEKKRVKTKTVHNNKKLNELIRVYQL